MKLTDQQLTTFVSHIVATLPDSIEARKTVLTVLIKLLPNSRKDKPALMKMLFHLQAHESTQLEFSMFLK